MSAFLTKEIVGVILNALLPSIQPLLDLHKRTELHACVMIPLEAEGFTYKHQPAFDGALAGDQKKYSKPYDINARAKAELSIRTKMHTSEVVTRAPMLHHREIVFAGGVYVDGIVVGVSGAPAPVDEAIAMMIAVCLKAHCQVEVGKVQAAALTGGSVFTRA